MSLMMEHNKKLMSGIIVEKGCGGECRRDRGGGRIL